MIYRGTVVWMFDSTLVFQRLALRSKFCGKFAQKINKMTLCNHFLTFVGYSYSAESMIQWEYSSVFLWRHSWLQFFL